MSAPDPAFRAALAAALAAPEGPPVGARFAAPLVTAIVADAGADEARLVPALEAVLTALTRAGVPRGRQFVLLGHDEAPPDGARERARRWREELRVPVLVHEPAGATFTAARLVGGIAVELDDELREAEAIVSVGEAFVRDHRLSGGPRLVCPGTASLATRAAFARVRDEQGEPAALARVLEAERWVSVDLALWWDERGQARAGDVAALARAFERELPRA